MPFNDIKNEYKDINEKNDIFKRPKDGIELPESKIPMDVLKSNSTKFKDNNSFTLSEFSRPKEGLIELPQNDKAIFVNQKDLISDGEILIDNVIPSSNGKWSGEKGDSKWYPDGSYIPKEKKTDSPYSNPENLTWAEILKKYGIDGIEFKDGEPDFSEVSKGSVEIDDFTDNRNENFAQADEKLAEQRGCTPEEVREWRKEHNYTWHECGDCKTMQKVPNEVHANVSHSGGISEYKKQNKQSENI